MGVTRSEKFLKEMVFGKYLLTWIEEGGVLRTERFDNIAHLKERKADLRRGGKVVDEYVRIRDR